MDQIRFDRISSIYGLPTGGIVEIIEDDFGFLWFATDEGLFRYDGYEFKAFRHDVQDSTTLSHPSLNGILKDHQNNIWVATTYGLNKHNRRTGSFEKTLPFPSRGRKSKGGNYTNVLFQDSQKKLWAVCQRKLLRFNIPTMQFDMVQQKDSPEVKCFKRSFFERDDGSIWICTDKGLLKVEPGDSVCQFVFPHPDPQSDYNNIKKIHEGTDGSFWLATKKGLAKWHPISGSFESDFVPEELKNTPVNTIMQDRMGNLWLAFEKRGLGAYNPSNNKFNHFIYQPNRASSLISNSVTSLYEDKFDNIWIGTINGICKIKMHDDGFKLIQHSPGLESPKNYTLRVFQDSDGHIWTKTPEGIIRIDRGEKGSKHFHELDDFKEQVSRGWFLEDHEGGIWTSIGDKGIFRKAKNEKAFNKMPLSDRLSNNGINRILIDNKNPDIVWVGSTEGLCRLNWKTREEQWYFPQEKIPEVASNQVSIFEQYGKDEIWLYYTYSNCMGRFDKATGDFELFVPPAEKSAALEGAVKDIAIGSDGNLWLATLYGLTNFNINSKEFSMYGKKEGMLENELSTVLIDHSGDVWVGGNRFFSKFDSEKKTFQNFNVTKEIRHFNTKSRHVAADGSILIGGINGVYAFHPDKISKNEKPPSVVLTDFKVKNESYLLDQTYEEVKSIILPYNENDISFSFSGIHFINPNANEYKCKLIGFDDNWRELGREHKMSYTNLNPGQYSFKAIASNSDGLWNDEGLNIKLIITPPFWQTLWFKSLLVLMAVSISYALFKNRQHQLALKREKDMAEKSAEYKTRFLANVSHEIRTPMNAIIGLSKLALDTPLNQKQTKFINAIRQSSQNLLNIINDLLDHTKLESGKFTFVKKQFDLSILVDQLHDTFNFKADEKQINFELRVAPDIPINIIGDPLRLNQILTNLLANSLKFTDEGSIWLDIRPSEEKGKELRFRFEVGDTGIGIAQNKIEAIFERFSQIESEKKHEKEGTGLGLTIARQLVERQGSQLFIESTLGKGTKLWFELNFEKGVEQTANSQSINSTKRNFSDLNILIVEDNYFNQMLMVEILKNHVENLKFEIAENGKVALNKLTGEHDLIIMDVKMPVMNGYDTTKAIRALSNKKIAQTPIIAVTANALPEQIKKCKVSGMDSIVTKPIDHEILLNSIHELIENKTNVDLGKLKTLMGGDEKMVEKFLAIFKSQTPEQLVELKSHAASGNWEHIGILAHTIKSQCQYLGLENIAEKALEIELITEEKGDLESAQKLILDLEKELTEIIKTIP